MKIIRRKTKQTLLIKKKKKPLREIVVIMTDKVLLGWFELRYDDRRFSVNKVIMLIRE